MSDGGPCAPVRRAGVIDAPAAVAIIREAAAWAAARGTPVWEPQELREEAFAHAAARRELVIGYAGETPVATMLLQTADPLYWPQDAPGVSFYLHKIAIRRAYAGQSWLARLLEFAAREANGSGVRYLRLDTILRPRLQSLYECHGFRVLVEEPLLVAGRRMIRMERRLR